MLHNALRVVPIRLRSVRTRLLARRAEVAIEMVGTIGPDEARRRCGRQTGLFFHDEPAIGVPLSHRFGGIDVTILIRRFRRFQVIRVIIHEIKRVMAVSLGEKYVH